MKEIFAVQPLVSSGKDNGQEGTTGKSSSLSISKMPMLFDPNNKELYGKPNSFPSCSRTDCKEVHRSFPRTP